MDVPTAPVNEPAVTPLRALVEERVNQRWQQWAAEHPSLAAAIDRVNLVESATARLREDPEFQAALRQADLDEARLAAAARALELADRWVGRLMKLAL